MHDISENFHTEVGYITRAGLTRFKAGIMRMFYPQSNTILRIDPMIHSRQVRDKFSGLYETFNAFDIRLMLKKNSSFIAGARYVTEIFLSEKFNTSALRAGASSQLTKQFFISVSYFYQKKIRYIETPFQGHGNDANVTLTYLPSEKVHFDLSAIYSDFYRDSDSIKEYDCLIIRSKNTYQWSKYLFFRAIFEYNSFRKQFSTDFIASFTYIPVTVIYFGYGSLYEKIQRGQDHYIGSDNFLETKRGFFFKASYLWRL
ncbi:MAG: hypothetical protein A2Y62_11020 [Candidatus Fischerbacteria bacterium RBG_13_37_8]|uniref:TonB-dependent receptor-like beta-barrel domain-containing protein n=1 Tax=Candidatus Fischerbacteria bacterium RBG_13_37_8 TaxID=1817863 RepID=A0A1F5V609_9BACT|nr:MAG: hypothetical protein A2Y62_11020 [Candidatus Fischerbacteria bacterium RBG_13_37_8]